MTRFFSNVIVKNFDLPHWTRLIILPLLWIPYGLPLFIGNFVLTEALCYPFFLGAMGAFLNGICKERLKYFFIFLGWTALLVMTHRRFMMLYPMMFIFLGYAWIWRRKVLRAGVLSIAFVSAILAINLAERTYQYSKTGDFKTLPFTGVHAIVTPLFLANAADKKLFEDPAQKDLFEKMFNELQARKINYDAIDHENSFFLSPFERFQTSFDTVVYKVVLPVVSAHLTQRGQKADHYMIDQVCWKMVKTLTFANFPDRLIFYVRLSHRGLGYFYSFMMLFAIIGCLILFKREISLQPHHDPLHISRIVALLSLLGINMINYATICLVHWPLRRYTFYTDLMQLIALGVIIFKAFEGGFFRNKVKKAI